MIDHFNDMIIDYFMFVQG